MKFNIARRRCSAINALLNKIGLQSYASVKTKNSGNYYLVIYHYNGEQIPTKLKNIKCLPQQENENVTKTHNTPSNPGKWIDKPLSPANRQVDGPGATGYPRSNPELQDMVKRVASDLQSDKLTNIHIGEKTRMKKIAARLRLLAKVERIVEIDKLLQEMSRLMKTSNKITSSISSLFDRFSESYDSSLLPKLKDRLLKAGYKRRDNIVKLVDQISSILKNADIKQDNTNKNPKIIQNTQEVISNIVKVLPELSRNLNSLDLISESDHIRSIQSDLVDINKVIARLAR